MWQKQELTTSDRVVVKALQSIGRRLFWQDIDLRSKRYESDPPDEVELDVANLIGSPTKSRHQGLMTKIADKTFRSSRNNDDPDYWFHAPTLDIDIPAYLIPSSTPGHSHLYIDVEITWDKYVKLLNVMAECGILEEGYVKASIAKGGTYVRLPHIKKPPPPNEPEGQEDIDF